MSMIRVCTDVPMLVMWKYKGRQSSGSSNSFIYECSVQCSRQYKSGAQWPGKALYRDARPKPMSSII